ncbi:MAG: carboxymuconolactone decarboxylase family protein [Acidobacteria bacterium]|nr:carboxymuconolactone decarboxylase family protein [Acidobacteriota bacterium]
MSQFTIHTVDSAPAASRETLTAVQKKFGFLPNLLGELAATPAALQAYVTLNELLGRTSLSPVAQQVLLVAASMANGCHYCVAAHTAGLKMAGFADDQIGALRAGRALADAKLEALRVFTIDVVERRGRIGNAELQPFLDAGYAREQVFEVLVGVAMKTLSNYSNHIADTPLDKQLQPLAWEPAAASAGA